MRDLQRELNSASGRIFDLEQRLEDTMKSNEKSRLEKDALIREKNDFQNKVSVV